MIGFVQFNLAVSGVILLYHTFKVLSMVNKVFFVQLGGWRLANRTNWVKIVEFGPVQIGQTSSDLGYFTCYFLPGNRW